MKKSVITIMAIVAGVMAYAAGRMWFHCTDHITLGLPVEMVDSVSTDGVDVLIYTVDGASASLSRDVVERVTVGDGVDYVDIVYDANGVTVVNPFAFEGVDVEKNGAHVTVRSSIGEEITYRLSGTTADGAFKIYSDKKFVLELDGVSITNTDGAAVNIQSSKKTTMHLAEGTVSSLTDSKKYTSTPEGEDEKGCLFSEGQIIFTGTGALSVTGVKKHAIVSDDYIEIRGGKITVNSSASDGIHVNDYFIMTDGEYYSRATTGDGIDAGTGYIEINGGVIDVEVATDDTKGVKCDSIITMTGGDVRLNVSGNQAKGFKTKQSMTMTGGNIKAETSGSVVVTAGDPSYCTAIKTDGDFVMSGGQIEITATGEAGKGISVDGNARFAGGNVVISTSGNGDTYTDVNGATDSYSSTCITIDGNLELIDGVFELSSSGSAGKCIKVDMDATFGDPTHCPTVTAITTGAKFVESSSGSTGGWGGPGDNTDYANPKVIKAAGNLTVNNGIFTLTSTQDGGEGLESKDVLTINGGEINIATVDDCINASNSVVINGGRVHCVASGNDAIDSNGTLAINGGTVIAIGARQPEGGLDCDQNTLAITGGTVVAIGGSNSSPTSSACSQRTVNYKASLSQNTTMTIVAPDGGHILSFTNPVNYGNSCAMIITSPELEAGKTYTVYTGGTVTGGDVFYELTTDAEYTSGTRSTTFTVSSMVTSVGSTGGWGRP